MVLLSMFGASLLFAEEPAAGRDAVVSAAVVEAPDACVVVGAAEAITVDELNAVESSLRPTHVAAAVSEDCRDIAYDAYLECRGEMGLGILQCSHWATLVLAMCEGGG
ncbi:MAG TPA: hypothetical protein VHW00_19175 [Thermoanaerobaculia bacterium]|nr:hypothetical protein [Thermoanaerobaculia bacterium]